jgi:hypothetical protein
MPGSIGSSDTSDSLPLKNDKKDPYRYTHAHIFGSKYTSIYEHVVTYCIYQIQKGGRIHPALIRLFTSDK